MEQYISKEFPDGASVEAALLRAKAGGAIDIALQKKVNPNLLDNWYFGNPVNQRGVTSGTAGWSEYFIDRWKGYCIYDVTKGYLELSSGSYIVQNIENGGSIPYPVTFSILFQDGTFGYQTVYADGGFSLIGENIKGFADSQIHGENPYISYNNNSGSTVGIIAVKLELGDQQTLAHQDADGNWVLNEIPDYGEQLGRCQRYYRQFNAYTKFIAQYIDGTKVVFVLPVSMRTAPGMRGDWKIYTGFTAQTGFTLNTYQTGNIIVVEAVKENHGLTSAWLGVNGICALNADL